MAMPRSFLQNASAISFSRCQLNNETYSLIKIPANYTQGKTHLLEIANIKH